MWTLFRPSGLPPVRVSFSTSPYARTASSPASPLVLWGLALALLFIPASWGLAQSNGSVTWNLPGGGEDAQFFPCDAGVIHLPLAQERLCRFRDTAVACSREQDGLTFTASGISLGTVTTLGGTLITAETESSHRCECLPKTSHKGDLVRYKLAVPADGSEGGVLSSSAKGAVVSAQRLLENPSTLGRIASSFAEPLAEVTFSFGSEAFGTQYFLDLCYLGTPPKRDSQTSTSAGLPDFGTGAFMALANPGVNPGGLADLASTYESLSGLRGNWDLACSWFDVKGSPSDLKQDARKLAIEDLGARPLPGNLGAGASAYALPPAAEEGWVGRLKSTFSTSGDIPSLGTQVRYLFGSSSASMGLSRGADGLVPRACRMRLYFWEAGSGAARSWQRGGARFTVKWDVSGGTQ